MSQDNLYGFLEYVNGIEELYENAYRELDKEEFKYVICNDRGRTNVLKAKIDSEGNVVTRYIARFLRSYEASMYVVRLVLFEHPGGYHLMPPVRMVFKAPHSLPKDRIDILYPIDCKNIFEFYERVREHSVSGRNALFELNHGVRIGSRDIYSGDIFQFRGSFDRVLIESNFSGFHIKKIIRDKVGPLDLVTLELISQYWDLIGNKYEHPWLLDPPNKRIGSPKETPIQGKEKGEGDICGIDGCQGHLKWQHDENLGGCSCHIVTPCSYCTDQLLVCDTCGERFSDGQDGM